MSNSQPHNPNQPPDSQANLGDNESPPVKTDDQTGDQGNDVLSPEITPPQRNSLTVAELAGLGASNNSTTVFRQNAARTLRSELNADAVLIIDYTDAFGGKVVRAVSGVDTSVIDSEIWLPEWLSPVDLDSPMKMVDVDPARFTAITAMDPESEFRSAVAIAIPGITGSAGIITALSNQPIDFNDAQIENAKIIASLLSFSASRRNALDVAQRDESQIAASRHIARSSNFGTSETTQPKSLLGKISDQLIQFFDFDVIALRVQSDGEFSTQESLGADQNRSYSFPKTNSSFDEPSIESRSTDFSVALTNNSNSPRVGAQHGASAQHGAGRQHSQDSAWKSAGIESILAIPVISSTNMVIVLGSSRPAAYTPESLAIANRFVPALAAAFAAGSAAPVEAVSLFAGGSNVAEYVESIASATEIVSACGVIATQITNRTEASRVRIGFIDEETGRAQLGFDTESSNDALDLAWISPDEIEILVEAPENDQPSARYATIRTPIKVSRRPIGYVEATKNELGFDEADHTLIKEITAACATVIATLRQLEQSQATLNKLEMLQRVTEQIRSDTTGSPLQSPKIASFIRNLFDADWIYFGSVDHENDHATTEITDGLDVPQLATGVRVSRRSLLIPSTLAVAGPVIVDLESAAPGFRASGRWMYRAGLRSAVCAPLRLNGAVTKMFMCGSRKPTGFGSLEKKIAQAVVSELELPLNAYTTLART